MHQALLLARSTLRYRHQHRQPGAVSSLWARNLRTRIDNDLLTAHVRRRRRGFALVGLKYMYRSMYDSPIRKNNTAHASPRLNASARRNVSISASCSMFTFCESAFGKAVRVSVACNVGGCVSVAWNCVPDIVQSQTAPV